MSSEASTVVTSAAVGTALVYGIAVIGVAGGAGIWIPAVMPDKSVGIDALTSFVMATVAPLVADMLLDAEIYGKGMSKFFRAGIVLLAFAACAFALVALLREHFDYAWSAGWLAVVLTLIIWFMLAMTSPRFAPIPHDKSGSIGGEKPSSAGLSGGGLT